MGIGSGKYMKLKASPKLTDAKKVTAPAITYPDLRNPGKATFIVADRTTRVVPWTETPSLPSARVQDVVTKAECDNDEVSTSYGYDTPTLVKLQDAQIAIAAEVDALLGENPAHTDDDNAYFALTIIRDLLPDPFSSGRAPWTIRAVITMPTR